MGPRLLCFAGGTALSAYFLHLGLLLTPFFGAGAFLWASVMAAYLLALALGYGLGDLLARLAGPKELEKAAPRMAALGGLLAIASTYLSPAVCRLVLDRDPGWSLAPLAALAISGLLPGTLIAAAVPSEVRARVAQSESMASAQGALRLVGLVVLGGVVGVALSGRSLLALDEIDVGIRAYLIGGTLTALSACFLGKVGRILCALGLGACAAVIALHPSEVQSQQFAVELALTWKEQQGTGSYYFGTAGERLSDEELARRARQELEHEKPGVIMTCEMLDALGAVSVTGEGLCRSLDLLLQPESKPYLMPLFEQLAAVRSDGKGILHCTIKRRRGVEGAPFKVPGDDPGETIDFLFRDDFTIRMIKEGTTWKLEFGPVTTVRAGVFEFNDTRQTPLRIQNVALWVDASLLGIVIEDRPQQVVIRAVAQGEIGDVKTVEVMAIAKDRRGKAKGKGK